MLFVAGCGSAARPPASSAGQSFASFAAAADRYASCVRNHGVTSFPSPVVIEQPGRQLIHQPVPSALENTPQFKRAKAACRALLPPSPPNRTQGPAHPARARDKLAFARCLRSHGVPKFPDPSSQGQLTLQMVISAGVDMHAPVVLTAAKACLATAHGAITGAQVVRAIDSAP